MPLAYCAAINGAEIAPPPDLRAGERQGCQVGKGPAIRDMAAEAGFRACWSEPILASDGVILGTSAIYHREPRSPIPEERTFIKAATNTVAGVIRETLR